MSHQAVLKILEKSWTAGVQDTSKANYHVGQKRLHARVPCQKGGSSKIIPLDDGEFEGFDIVVDDQPPTDQTNFKMTSSTDNFDRLKEEFNPQTDTSEVNENLCFNKEAIFNILFNQFTK